MDWLWTWGGECFGYMNNNNLWTFDGRHVGKCVNGDIYDKNGCYIGEVNEDRLITNLSKINNRRSAFTPQAQRGSFLKYVNYAKYVMIAGCKDLPSPEDL